MHKTSRKREIDINLPALKRHVRGNIQSVLQEMESFVSSNDIDSAKLEYIDLIKKEHTLKHRYPELYQEVLINGIVETQKTPRRMSEDDSYSKLREILIKASREPSISKYASGTALYELASLKRSDKMFMNLSSTVGGTPRNIPKRMTIMDATPREKLGSKKTNRNETRVPDVSNKKPSLRRYEDVLRTVEYQQSKIDNLTKRLCGGEIDDIRDSKAIRIAKSFRAVFDYEWADAFREMNSWFRDKENEIMYNLIKIVKFIYPFCEKAANEQFINLTASSAVPLLQPFKLPYLLHALQNYVKNHCIFDHAGIFIISKPLIGGKDIPRLFKKDNRPSAEQREVLSSGEKFAKRYRSEVASVSVPQLCQKFKETVIENEFRWDHTRLPKSLRTYIDRCIEVIWHMCVIDPPIAVVWPSEGDTVDINMYDFHSSRGKVVKLCVWPALLLSVGGPVLSKGRVLAGEK